MNPPADTSAVPVIVFARAPVPGRCKTRLIPGYGRIGAARLYRRLVCRTLALALESHCGEVQLWVAPSPGHPFFAGLHRRHGVRLRRQPGGDLGRRMSRALASVLMGGAPGALLVGTDAANLCAQDFRDAASRLLADSDVVLQPASDGGYVLIGLRHAIGEALRGVTWSSGRECAQTRARLSARNLRVAVMPMREDIDHPGDVRRARRAGSL